MHDLRKLHRLCESEIRQSNNAKERTDLVEVWKDLYQIGV